MKKTALLIICITSSYLHAQIGVKTSEVTSTLTVNGSISGKYVDVKASTYQIQQDDYNIAYSGGSENKGTFILPEVKDADSTFAGRIYYIKNLTENKTLQIKTSTGQYIRFGGSLEEQKSVNLLPGRFIAIIANNNSGQARWDLNILGVEEKLPEVKVLEYLKVDLPLDKMYSLEESTVTMGNLTLGYLSYGLNNGVIKFKLRNNTTAISLSNKAPSGTGVSGQFSDNKKAYYSNLTSGTWEFLNIGASNCTSK